MDASGSSSSGSNVASTKLKVSGLWSGVIEVDLEEWSVAMLRAEVAKTSLCSPQNLKVIFGGKILKDELADKKLGEVGFWANSRILISKVDANEAKAIKDEVDAQNRLARIKAAVDAMAKRLTDKFHIELGNQSREKSKVGSVTDQRALLMGLMLHAKGRRLIKMGKYKDALDVLGTGEEAFSICNPKVMEKVGNASLLQIDIVWCYFMLRDISCLAVAGIRLKEARKGLQLCSGANVLRARVIRVGLGFGFCLETVTYTRLELLEGVMAYHMGLLEESYKALTSAQARYRQLQVSDESLATLVNMGLTTKQSKRALRMCSQDVGRAMQFVIEERERIANKKEEDKQHHREIREQKSYGRTPLGKAVDMTKLTRLASNGYERTLAAEALRRNENDFEKALDELTNPASNSALQASLECSLRRRNRIREVIAEMIRRALLHGGTEEEAVGRFLQQLQNAGAGSSALLHGRTREEAIGRIFQQLQNAGAGSSASRQPESAPLEGQGQGHDKEQKYYGRTPLGKAVDMTKLPGLASIGYERTLAAEALRRNENDFEKALDELTNPTSNSALQASLECSLRRRNRIKEEIAEMIRRALLHGGTRKEAISRFLQQLQNAGAGSSALLHGGTREEAIGRILQQLQNAGAGSSASRQPESAPLEGQGQGRDKEQKSYGRTPLGKAVDMTKLPGLASIGYERTLAAEALECSLRRRNRIKEEIAEMIRRALLHGGTRKEAMSRLLQQLQNAGAGSSALLHGGTREEAIGRILQQLQNAGAGSSASRQPESAPLEGQGQGRDKEQKSDGRTPLGKAVDMTKLPGLASIGYERTLAAEALRRNRRKEEIAEMIRRALLHGGTRKEAIGRLLQQLQNAGAGSSALLHGGTREEAIGRLLQLLQNADAGSSASRQPESAPLEGQGQGRDKEMEEDIVNSLTGDPVADYDSEFEEEGQAIAEYLSLVLTARQSVSL